MYELNTFGGTFYNCPLNEVLLQPIKNHKPNVAEKLTACPIESTI